MFIAALLVLLIAAVLFVIGVFGGGGTATLDMWPIKDAETTSAAVFLAGMVTLLLFVASLAMFRTAGRRAAARRRDRRKVSELSQKLEQFERDRDHPDSGPTGH